MPLLDALKNKGFTLLETLVILLILGIGLAIATPSFLSAMEKFRLEQAVVEVRSAFRESQKEAIRQAEACFVVMDLNKSQLTAPCINMSQRSLPERVKLATNINLLAEEPEPSGNLKQLNGSYSVASTSLNELNLEITFNIADGIKIGACYGQNSLRKTFCVKNVNGGNGVHPKVALVNFGILGTAEFDLKKPNLAGNALVDPTAKIVFYASDAAKSFKRCIAISKTLGLTRAGLYSGAIEPEEITSSGICKASE